MGDSIVLFRESSHIIKEQRHVQRVVKKHLPQKYLLCGFAIHAFVASPVYLYGIIVDNNSELIIRIWSPIIYRAIGQIFYSFLLHSNIKTYQTKNYSQQKNRRIFLLATFFICFSIMLCGFLYSSAWIKITPTTQIIAVIVYGFFGGIGSSLIYVRTYKILEIVRPKEDKYIQKTINLCGEAFCQLFLSFVLTSLRHLYGISQTLQLMSAILINLIPLGLLITKQNDNNNNNNNDEKSKRKLQFIRSHESIFQGINRLQNQSSMDQLDGIELQQTTWKNPRNTVEMHCNYVTLTSEDTYTTYFNSNGVEIMEIIPEEDENISVIRSSSATIDKQSRISNEQFNNGNCNTNNNNNNNHTTNIEKIQNFSTNLINHIVDSVFIPLQRAIFILKIYPATFLQSTDIFSYVMCLTVLPGIAIFKHSLKFAEIPFLYSLLAFPWMCFALMTPRFGHSLIKEKNKWHIFGCILKGLGLMFTGVSTSKLLLSLAAVFLGFGQAITMFLQDSIIQNGIPKAQWIDVKCPLYFINGILILIWAFLAHIIINTFNFQTSAIFSSLLYFSSIIVWYIFDKGKDVGLK